MRPLARSDRHRVVWTAVLTPPLVVCASIIVVITTATVGPHDLSLAAAWIYETVLALTLPLVAYLILPAPPPDQDDELVDARYWALTLAVSFTVSTAALIGLAIIVS